MIVSQNKFTRLESSTSQSIHQENIAALNAKIEELKDKVALLSDTIERPRVPWNNDQKQTARFLHSLCGVSYLHVPEVLALSARIFFSGPALDSNFIHS
jgi:hypothetical protein